MKIAFLLLPIALFPLVAGAQPVPDAPRYWIFFKDRPPSAGNPAAMPDHLTLAALERRDRRATYTGTERDLPLSAAYLDALARLQVEIHVTSRWLNAVSAPLSDAQRVAVSALPFVTRIRPVAQRVPLAQSPSFPVVFVQPLPDARQPLAIEYGPSITQLKVVNAVPPLEAGLSGEGVSLGIIDTGLGDLPDIHPATAALVSAGRFIESRDFTGQPADNSRHGYSVLSVAAGFEEGQLVGPAHGATVYHARTEYTPTETNQEEDNFVAGLEWMEAEGVDVVNISLGYTTFDPGEESYTVADLDGETGITTQVADMAVDFGMVVVASAGNEGCSSPASCWFYITTPADGDNVIAVGAVDADSVLASFSSRGPTADGRTKPDVAAQGAAVYLANSAGGYSFSNGTSFSSPMVAGVAALMLEANPALTPVQVRSILRTTASQAAMPDNRLGWGIIDANAAILEAVAIGDPTHNEPAPGRTPLHISALYPNPVLNVARLPVTNAGPPMPARLSIYDSQGKSVTVAFDGWLATGTNPLSIDMRGLAAGLYLYRLETAPTTSTGRFIKL